MSLELALARGPLAGHSEPPRSRSPSLAPGHEARILAVDDDDASRQLVSEALRSVGFVVDEARPRRSRCSRTAALTSRSSRS